jgi:hypothetical protein
MASEYNLYIDQGVTFSNSITISDDYGNPVDLTGATLASQVRKSFISTTAWLFTITVTDPTNGVVVLSMTADQTGSMKPGRYVYDAQYTDSVGNTVRFLKGIVTIFPAATRLPYVAPAPYPQP